MTYNLGGRNFQILSRDSAVTPKGETVEAVWLISIGDGRYTIRLPLAYVRELGNLAKERLSES